MRLRCVLYLLLCASAGAQTHFKYLRAVSVPDANKQSYVVVDETLLGHMSAGMGDFRLYSDSGREVQYVLREQRAVRYSDWSAARILNKGLVNGDTQFTLDISQAEYDRLRLELATKDFVAKATVEGADDAAAKTWNNLGTHSLYDFSKEKLGSSDIIQLKAPARYRYLRLTISGGVPPQDVESVMVANLQEDKARYVPLSAQARIEQRGNHTVVSWDTSVKIPVERIVVEVDPREVSFSRETELFCDGRMASRAELSRVRLIRKGRQIESESLALEPYGMRCKSYRLDIFNADNPPLRISAVRPLMLERRIYFEPQGESGFKLYYGDPKTNAPRYDYARFFEPAVADKVAAAQLQAEALNPNFTEWPDDRPWSERNQGLLWVVMIVAVGLLGAWALKGFKS